jgi:hypothetical protein
MILAVKLEGSVCCNVDDIDTTAEAMGWLDGRYAQQGTGNLKRGRPSSTPSKQNKQRCSPWLENHVG